MMSEDAFEPRRATSGSAGYDLKSVQDVEIESGSREQVKTGVILEIPNGFYGQIKSRSGLTMKFGLDVAGGVIDSDYRGEIIVILCNNGKKKYKVSKGDSIAQIIVVPYAALKLNLVSSLTSTKRGNNGFGSTD